MHRLRPQRSGGVPLRKQSERHLHPSADSRRDKAGEGRGWCGGMEEEGAMVRTDAMTTCLEIAERCLLSSGDFALRFDHAKLYA